MITKKDFIALADAIRNTNLDFRVHTDPVPPPPFTPSQIDVLAEFCHSRNPRFNRARWLGYIHGECGPNGGAIRKPKKGGAA